jgi:hypothetical protein
MRRQVVQMLCSLILDPPVTLDDLLHSLNSALGLECYGEAGQAKLIHDEGDEAVNLDNWPSMLLHMHEALQLDCSGTQVIVLP